MAKTITLSLNEMRALLFRYFEVTFSHTHDFYDAARLVLWLEARGLAGIEALLSMPPSPKGMASPVPLTSRDRSNWRQFDLRDTNTICAGLAIADLCVSDVKISGVAGIYFRNNDFAPMPVPLIANCAVHGVWACAAYRMPEDGFTHIALMKPGTANPDIFTVAGQFAPMDLSDGDAIVMCAETEEKFADLTNEIFGFGQASRKDWRRRKTAEDFACAYQEAVSQGVTIAVSDYQRLCLRADDLLVEASEASRRGAGD